MTTATIPLYHCHPAPAALMTGRPMTRSHIE